MDASNGSSNDEDEDLFKNDFDKYFSYLENFLLKSKKIKLKILKKMLKVKKIAKNATSMMYLKKNFLTYKVRRKIPTSATSKKILNDTLYINQLNYSP